MTDQEMEELWAALEGRLAPEPNLDEIEAEPAHHYDPWEIVR